MTWQRVLTVDLQAEARVRELRACKARHTNDRQARLQPWDRHFWAAKLRVSPCAACLLLFLYLIRLN